MTTLSQRLRAGFGEIDIYLFDQIARGRFDTCRTVLDAGCGDGRNLRYLLSQGVRCYGIDRDAAAIARSRALVSMVAPEQSPGQFVIGDLERLPWEDGSMDAVICSAVLHFARDAAQCLAQVNELWRVVAPGGVFFARLASTIGLEPLRGVPAGQRVALPDGTERFVVDEALLLAWTAQLGGALLDPIKTTNVQETRAMTTWCLRKPGAARA
ncbi:MAG: class I SAM-dependent methyltransferase [Vicinamibacterales bacterium]